MLLMLPSFAAAQSVADLQTQINALLQQLQQLQQLQAQLTARVSNPLTTSVPSITGGTTACKALTSNLGPGSSGADVTFLQQFLAQDPSIYPEAITSGYYGSLTVAAVQRWQTAHGIASSGSPSTNGYGALGPRTREAIGCVKGLGASGYASSGYQSSGAGTTALHYGGTLDITPTQGYAPLTLVIHATVNTANDCAASSYTIDYGDASGTTVIPVSAGVCKSVEQTTAHTYEWPGTYTITLSAGAYRSTLRVSVFEGGSALGPDSTPEVTPLSGKKPLVVVVQFDRYQTSPYEISWGDGSSAATDGTFAEKEDQAYDSSLFPSEYQGVKTQHTYSTPGSYQLKLRIQKWGTSATSSSMITWGTQEYSSLITVSP